MFVIPGPCGCGPSDGVRPTPLYSKDSSARISRATPTADAHDAIVLFAGTTIGASKPRAGGSSSPNPGSVLHSALRFMGRLGSLPGAGTCWRQAVSVWGGQGDPEAGAGSAAGWQDAGFDEAVDGGGLVPGRAAVSVMLCSPSRRARPAIRPAETCIPLVARPRVRRLTNPEYTYRR